MAHLTTQTQIKLVHYPQFQGGLNRIREVDGHQRRPLLAFNYGTQNAVSGRIGQG